MDLITEQRLWRRQRMLDAVREAVAEIGWAELTVRDLARRCRVSVPTLYNQFGGKEGLLTAAAEGHFRQVLERVTTEGGPRGWRRLLALAARSAENMTRQSAYHRSLVAAFGAARETGPAQAALVRDLTAAFAAELEFMRAQGQLADWVDLGLLASQLTAACVSASAAWARGHLSDGGLRASMPHSVGTLVLGVARGSARRGLEGAARREQAALLAESQSPRAPRRARRAAAAS
ncbi:MAG TPA: TetR/AcrR family transcriptional regulator [Myxococcota bacterium]|nr:TetR/AcrR family transcriptional regulator [Myxococcota bacterium]